MTRYALVPAEATEEIIRAGYRLPAGGGEYKRWQNMIAASPGQGAVTAEQLEAAAEAVHAASNSGRAWSGMHEYYRGIYRTHARAAFEAIGLTVQP